MSILQQWKYTYIRPFHTLMAKYGLAFHADLSMKSLKNAHHGKRAFLIGNGPSLQKTNLSILGTEITFGVNRIYLHFSQMGFQPTYYFVEDSSIIHHHAAEINQKVTRSIRIIPYVYARALRGDYFVNYSPYPPIFQTHFSRDAEKIVYWGGVCTFAVMQLAYYMGIQALYLVGFDHNWNTISPGQQAHFIHNYLENDKVYNIQKEMHHVDHSYRLARAVYEKAGRKIINCTVGGNLEIFPREDYTTVVDCSTF